MILFNQDWAIPQYENLCATVHTSTKNTSFLKMYKILDMMGIKNNLFMLALVFPELEKIDPHNLKDDSIELKMKIAIECKINPWYYFREVIRLPFAGDNFGHFLLDRANLALIWAYYNNIDLFETISRQLGKTVSTQAIMSHVQYFWGFNINVGMFTNTRKLVNENVDRLKSIRDNLPKYLLNITRKDTDNKEGLAYNALKTKYLTFVVPDSEHDANNVARGMTLVSNHWDEFGYTKHNRIAYSVATTSTSTAAAQARINDMPCSDIITTTAALLDEDSGRFAYEIMSNAMKFNEQLYESPNKETLVEIVRKNSTNNTLYISFSFLQLGKDWEWFHRVTTKANKSQDEIDTDYLLIWKRGAENGAVPGDLLSKIKDHEIKPIYTEIDKIDFYELKWYISESMRNSSLFKDKKIIIGMDSSENIGRDFSSLVIIDPEDMALLGIIKCNESNIIKFARFVVRLLLEFKKSIFIPERKSSGATIIDFVLMEFEAQGINPYNRIYNEVYQNYDDKKFKSINVNEYPSGEERKYFGFSTNQEKRNTLYKIVLLKALKLNYNKIYDTGLINEISGLALRNGRIDHMIRGHDDTIFAYLLTCYLIFFGNNIHKYGLNKCDYLNRVSETGDKVEPEELKKQNNLKIKILELERKLKNTYSLLLKKSYEKELKSLLALFDETKLPIESVSKEKVKHDTAVNKTITPYGIRNYFNVVNM